jgi:FkbM family methyltransferase
LNEPLESVSSRERNLFNQIAGDQKESMILFGAGKLGKSTLSRLRTLGINPLAFADNNMALWGKQIDGLPVYSPEDIVKTFSRNTSFLVTIRHPQYTFEHTRRQLLTLGCDKIIPVIALYWKFPEAFLPHYFIDLPHKILESRKEIRQAFLELGDEFSQKEYVAQLYYRLFLNQDLMQEPDHDAQYFPSGIPMTSQADIFVDCGAYDGDSIRSFLSKTKAKFNHIFAFEPDPKNYSRLSSYLQQLPSKVRSRITAKCSALGSRHERIRFHADGTPESTISTSEGVDVEVITLDDFLYDWIPTYIKMDIEGSEIEALIGAQQLIQRNKPALAICVYHQPEHLWRIPLLLRSLSNEYRLFLRPHDYEGWDLVCYAIPRSRLVT